ncbi:hypothetical protein RCL_jg24900.t1 [Rhizophagus clarus]|uniref:Uncharacterized protein n=1 Tax=Rhizophagus clarus TaxID=94130 RepID=A0A8H3QTJ9_9GLOM|nr:hypothetical protein RCL_jg24900.t1 [Rhizophagus clarus]
MKFFAFALVVIASAAFINAAPVNKRGDDSYGNKEAEKPYDPFYNPWATMICMIMDTVTITAMMMAMVTVMVMTVTVTKMMMATTMTITATRMTIATATTATATKMMIMVLMTNMMIIATTVDSGYGDDKKDDGYSSYDSYDNSKHDDYSDDYGYDNSKNDGKSGY